MFFERFTLLSKAHMNYDNMNFDQKVKFWCFYPKALSKFYYLKTRDKIKYTINKYKS